MFLEFSASNFRSIAERQTLCFTASHGKELCNNTITDPALPKGPHLLRSMVLYGPNAAGKSNFLRAIQCMQWLVLHSATGLQEGQALPVTPFKLSATQQRDPTEFELICSVDGVRYQYGFSTTASRICREWLIAYPEGRPQRWFEREWCNNQYTWSFGSKFKGEHKVWSTMTRQNALFLSTAVQLNCGQLKPLFHWITNRLLVVVGGASLSPSLTMDLLRNSEGTARLLRLMQAADIGIEGLELLESDNQTPRVRTIHRMADGKNSTQLDLMEEESAGTIRLFMQAGGWLHALAEGAVLVCDEIDTSLHPHIVRFLISLFHDPTINTHQAQLLCTTHDTSLLDDDLLRRDQIWFIEKDAHQASHLYPLLDFSPRKGEALERGYLRGRYGALPCLGVL